MPSHRRSAAAPAAPAAAEASIRVLKKYPNRRLYDTQTSSYITLADVKQMVLAGEVFEVRDAKTGDEITRSILLQIILEEETGGMPMFSTQMLGQVIRFYGHAMQGMMGTYLENNLKPLSMCKPGWPRKARACTTPAPSPPRPGPSSSAARRR